MAIIVDPSATPGTGVVLTRLWLNSAADPSDVMSFRAFTFTPAKAVDAEVRLLAGGRRRLIRRAGQARSHGVSIRRPTLGQRQWLDDHVGELVTIRDPRGGKYHGVYLSVQVPYTVDGANDVTLSLTEVTHSEAAS